MKGNLDLHGRSRSFLYFLRRGGGFAAGPSSLLPRQEAAKGWGAGDVATNTPFDVNSLPQVRGPTTHRQRLSRALVPVCERERLQAVA